MGIVLKYFGESYYLEELLLETISRLIFLFAVLSFIYFFMRWLISLVRRNNPNKHYGKYTLISIAITILFYMILTMAFSSSQKSDTASKPASSDSSKKITKVVSKKKESISKANSIKAAQESESSSTAKKESESRASSESIAESKSSSVADSESLAESSSAASKKSQEASQTDEVSYTKTGEWTVAASGMVFVSDANIYYTSVKNPSHYQYITQSAADAAGDTIAPRGNQFARP